MLRVDGGRKLTSRFRRSIETAYRLPRAASAEARRLLRGIAMRTFGLATVLFATLGAGVASAQPANYSLRTLITVPPTAANVQPGGAFTSFDIGFFDPVSRNYFIADRSNASVDIISGSTL